MDPLKDSGKGGGGGFRGRRLNGALVTAEVALSLVLLAGAGLLMRSFVELQTQDLGFRPERVLHARVPLPRGAYAAPAAKQQYFDQVLGRVRALPGVVSASVASTVPPFGGIRSEVDAPGRASSERWEALYQLCTEGYFETLGLKLRRGRLLTPVDVAGARQVAVVNETLGRRFFGTDDPVGRTIELKMLAHAARLAGREPGVRDRRRRGRRPQPGPAGRDRSRGVHPPLRDERIRPRHPGADRGTAARSG